MNIRNAKSHITSEKRQLHVHADQSELLLEGVQRMADGINMKVNTKKTQLLCIHPFQTDHISTYIRTNDGILKSEDTLKILGFTFDKSPNANYHVKQLINKFYGMLWSIRF